MVKIGFIGTGGIARAHARAFQQLDEVTLGAVYDQDEGTLDRFVKDFGGDASRSVEEVLDNVDAVYVLTPPKAHASSVLAAIERGLPVLCEKPITTDLAEARQMVEAAETNGTILAIGFNNRARPQLLGLREAVQSGALGQVLSTWIRRLGFSRREPGSNWRTTGGELAGMTIQSLSHDIDMLRYVVGEIASVSALTASSMPEVEGYDDNLTASLIFESGAIGNLHASWSSHIGSGSRGVIGTNGTMSIEGPGLWTMTHTRRGALGERIEHVEQYDRQLADDVGYVGTGLAFVKAITDGSVPLATGRDGLRTLEVSRALLESARTHQFVESRGFAA